MTTVKPAAGASDMLITCGHENKMGLICLISRRLQIEKN